MPTWWKWQVVLMNKICCWAVSRDFGFIHLSHLEKASIQKVHCLLQDKSEGFFYSKYQLKLSDVCRLSHHIEENKAAQVKLQYMGCDTLGRHDVCIWVSNGRKLIIESEFPHSFSEEHLSIILKPSACK